MGTKFRPITLDITSNLAVNQCKKRDDRSTAKLACNEKNDSGRKRAFGHEIGLEKTNNVKQWKTKNRRNNQTKSTMLSIMIIIAWKLKHLRTNTF